MRNAGPEARCRRAALVAGLLALLLCAGCGRSGAAGDGPGSARAGRVLFAEYCATCHGLDGRGEGPSTPGLLQPPPDLTRLTERYGSPLPRATVAEIIDGRRAFDAHGTREMPVWGEAFYEGDRALGVETSKRRIVELLVDYLVSIQRMRAA